MLPAFIVSSFNACKNRATRTKPPRYEVRYTAERLITLLTFSFEPLLCFVVKPFSRDGVVVFLVWMRD